jgi:hypothetical protein
MSCPAGHTAETSVLRFSPSSSSNVTSQISGTEYKAAAIERPPHDRARGFAVQQTEAAIAVSSQRRRHMKSTYGKLSVSTIIL